MYKCINKNQSQIANLITVGSRFAPVTKGNQQKKSNQVQLLQITMKQENGKSYEEKDGPHPQLYKFGTYQNLIK